VINTAFTAWYFTFSIFLLRYSITIGLTN
jgi:hypothetical protein